jgi:hypothetical protein
MRQNNFPPEDQNAIDNILLTAKLKGLEVEVQNHAESLMNDNSEMRPLEAYVKAYNAWLFNRK